MEGSERASMARAAAAHRATMERIDWIFLSLSLPGITLGGRMDAGWMAASDAKQQRYGEGTDEDVTQVRYLVGTGADLRN